MKAPRLRLTLTVTNLAILLLIAVAKGPFAAEPAPAVLRGERFVLVDDSGQVRAQLDVEPSGEVVLRLRDERGAIRVKVGASANGSGLLLLDEATEPAVHIVARRQATPPDGNTTSITLTGAGGERKVIAPDGP
jgi:hypothetical protein